MATIRGVGARRDVAALLNEFERQMPSLRDVINLVRAHVASADNIEASRFRIDRHREELATLTETTSAALVEAIRGAEGRVPEPPAPPKPSTDDGPALDRLLRRLDSESTSAGVSVLLTEADSVGLLDKLWSYAGPRLRSYAADEQRRHVAPSAHSAFTAWTRWTAKMARGARPDGATRKQQQAELRGMALAICDVIQLRRDVEQRLRSTSVPAPSSTTASGGGSGMIFGKYFEGKE